MVASPSAALRVSALVFALALVAACGGGDGTPSSEADTGTTPIDTGENDTGGEDAGEDVGADAGGEDAGEDATADTGGEDAGEDATADTGEDATTDAGGEDTGSDAGCVDTCDAEGASRCDGTIREVCLTSDAGCLEWGVGEDCADEGELCDDAGEDAICVPETVPTCDDGEQNGLETDVDCGGDCDPCAVDGGCEVGEDCVDGVCDGGLCLAGTCDDDVQNGNETDVDCGGDACDPCDDGDACVEGIDCLSEVCDDEVCVAPSCVDGVLNGDETDVDCGGACAPCAAGGVCDEAADCASSVCTEGICQTASCDDEVLNGDETDTDCGGDLCDVCGTGEDCGGDADCESGVCLRGVCQAASCGDGVQNAEETGIDCGGPICDLCGVGQGCDSGVDCTTGACVEGLCRRASCDDGVENGDETDVDCGGDCDPCEEGEGCSEGADCVDGVCGGGVCQPPSCIDRIRNGLETDTDCGGPCPDCPTGGRCSVGDDCVSGACVAGVCQAGTCDDGRRNGDETDVDCGGSCGACDDGGLCDGNIDCVSGYCGGGRCQAPSCADRVQNGLESDIDCGGPTCEACAVGQACVVRADCESNICTGGLCVAPTCDDRVQNGDETDVDCGGSCDPCVTGRDCEIGADCISTVCAEGTCTEPGCDDLVRNGTETDVDCGGDECGPCESGDLCDDASDCMSGVCFGGACAAPSCFDELRNGDETDVDCGGASCSRCAVGGRCLDEDDCGSGVCDAGFCQAGACDDRVRNGRETDVDCGGPDCSACGEGDGCLTPGDCLSGICTDDICQPALCDDGRQNGSETDVDCGGACDPCVTGRRCEVVGDCESGICDGGFCVDATCDDGDQNGEETDDDCGGPDCDACPDGEGCMIDSDCESLSCDTGVCVPASCSDGTQNGSETDIDCGGATCEPCLLGDRCVANVDCASGVCVGGVCEPPSCEDGLSNGAETDVDCGGPVCDACFNGRECVVNTDCVSGSCDIGNTDTCVSPDTPTCADEVSNGSETGVDCGGPICEACPLGEPCTVADDCESGICDFIETDTCIDATPSFEINEDFETGDLSRFDYTVSGATPWTIEDDASNCHGGDYCLRTDVFHAATQTTAIELDLSVREDTTISYWARLNTEEGANPELVEDDDFVLRFYIDGVLFQEISGVRPWQRYAFPVEATDPGGPNRVFRWEYYRSTYVDGTRPARNEVWIDDIDLPDWNTEPSRPDQVAPWNNTATTDVRPTFEWRTFDPDFDTVYYVMEYDTEPTFTEATRIPEGTATRWTPDEDLAPGIYYWRVRAKDDSNFRWTDWSETWSVVIDEDVPQGTIWRQTGNVQFGQNTNSANLVVTGSALDASLASQRTNFSRSLGPTRMPGTGTAVNFSFTGLPTAVVGNGSISVTACGEFGSSSEDLDVVRADGVVVTTNWWPRADCSDRSGSWSVPNIQDIANDGSITVTVDPSSAVYYRYCGTGCDDFRVSLSYVSGDVSTTTSTPISFTAFEDTATFWERIQWKGTGDVSVQVLDAAGDLLPESVLPGNAAGFEDKTIHMWDVDPALYPVIRLRASIGAGAEFTEWSVTGNNRFEWRFDNPGDQEGWIADDFELTPTVTVDAGIYTLSVPVSSTDPHIEYTFPQPVDATRFSRVEVRLRTGRDYRNETVSLFWDNNFGEIDVARSVDEDDVFLLDYALVAFALPDDRPRGFAWEGDIEAIRIDPVVRFLDAAGEPNAGVAYIDYIAIY